MRFQQAYSVQSHSIQLWLSLLLMHRSYSAGRYSDNVDIEELQERPRDGWNTANKNTQWQDLMMIPKNFDSQLLGYQDGRHQEGIVQDGRHHENAIPDGRHQKSAMHEGRRPVRADRTWQSVRLSSGRKFFYLASEPLSSFKIRPGHLAAIPRMPTTGVKEITITPPVVIPVDIGDHNARTADNSIAPLLAERRVGAIDVYRTTDQQIAIDNGDDADADNSIKPLLPESHPGAINAVRTTKSIIDNAGLGFPIIDPDAIDADDPDVLRMIASPRRPVHSEKNRKGNIASFFPQRLEPRYPLSPDKNQVYQARNRDFPMEYQGFPKAHQPPPKQPQVFAKENLGLTQKHQGLQLAHQDPSAKHLPKGHRYYPKALRVPPKEFQVIPSGHQVNPKKNEVFSKEYYALSKENHVIPMEQALPSAIRLLPMEHRGFQKDQWIFPNEDRRGISAYRLHSPWGSSFELQFPHLEKWVRQRYGIDAETVPKTEHRAAAMEDYVPQEVARNFFAETMVDKQPPLPNSGMDRNSLRFMIPSMHALAGLAYRDSPTKKTKIQSLLSITANPDLGGVLPLPGHPIDKPPGETANTNFPETRVVAQQFPPPIKTVGKPANNFWPVNINARRKGTKDNFPETGAVEQDNGSMLEWSPRFSSTQKTALAKWITDPTLSRWKIHGEDSRNVPDKHGRTAAKSEIVHAEKKTERSSTRALPSMELTVIDTRTTALPFPALRPRTWNRNPWPIWSTTKDAQWHDKTESATKADLNMEKNETMGRGAQSRAGDWARGSNSTGSDDDNGCFTSGRYITSLEWIDFFHEDSKLIAMATIAVALFLLVFLTTICIIRIYHRQKHSCHCVNLDLHCRLSDVQMAVFHLSFSQREKLSELLYDKLIEDGLTHLSRYFDGFGKQYAKQMDFNLLFDDLAPTFNLHNLTEANRSQNATPAQNIDLNDGLEHFLYGESEN